MIYPCILAHVQGQVRKFSKILPQNRKLKKEKKMAVGWWAGLVGKGSCYQL